MPPTILRVGLGEKLLSSLIAYRHQEGLGEVFVAAHEEDAGALDFYWATGEQEEKVVGEAKLKHSHGAIAPRFFTPYRFGELVRPASGHKNPPPKAGAV